MTNFYSDGNKFGPTHTDKLIPKQATSEEIPTSSLRMRFFAEEMKKQVTSIDMDIDVHFDREIGTMVVDIRDPDTDEIVKTIPSQHIIEFKKKMNSMNFEETKKGLLIDDSV